MSSSFDPYHKWLGIPPREQPPHHYRLLALPLFESDPEVIESAADQRMGHVRTYQAGRYSPQSQQILNELAAARVCLLSPQKKAAYDAELRAQLAPPAPPPSGVPFSPSPVLELAPGTPAASLGRRFVFPPDARVDAAPNVSPPRVIPSASPARRGKRSFAPIALGSALFLLSLGALWAVIYVSTPIAKPILVSEGRRAEADSGGSRDGREKPPPVHTPDPASVETEIPFPVIPLPADMTWVEPVPVDPPAPEWPGTIEPTPAMPDTSPVAPQADGEGPPASDPEAPDGPQHAMPEPGSAPDSDYERGSDLPSLADFLPGETAPAGEASPEAPSAAAEDEPEAKKSVRKVRIPSATARRKAELQLQSMLVTASAGQLLAEAQRPDYSLAQACVLLDGARRKAAESLDLDQAMQAVDAIGARFVCDLVEVKRETCLLLQQKLTSPRQARPVALEALRLSQEAEQKGEADRATFLGKFAEGLARASGDPQVIEATTAHLEQLPK